MTALSFDTSQQRTPTNIDIRHIARNHRPWTTSLLLTVYAHQRWKWVSGVKWVTIFGWVTWVTGHYH